MGPEPDIDAVHVERVETDRERTYVVAVFEFPEAHGAVATVSVGLGGVNGERDGLDDGLVEAVRGVNVEAVAWLEEGRVVG